MKEIYKLLLAENIDEEQLAAKRQYLQELEETEKQRLEYVQEKKVI